MNSLLKKCIAECLGTFVLVFVACGVAIVSNNLVATALAFGLVIVAMAYSIGNISGCHINPAVSFACAMDKRMSWKEFACYTCAQFVGGFLGAILLYGILKMCGVDAATGGSNFIIGGDYDVLKVIASLLLEVVLTFIFVYVILNVTKKDSKVSNIAGIIIGLTLTLVHLIGIALTGTSVNPARSLATALGNAIFYQDLTALSQVWIFLVAPIGGSALAALVFALLHKEKTETKETTTEE